MGVAVALSVYVLLGAVALGLWLSQFGTAPPTGWPTALVYVALALIVALGGAAAARIARRHQGRAGMAVGVVMTVLGLLVAARWPDAGGLWPYVVACLAGGAVAAWIGRRMD